MVDHSAPRLWKKFESVPLSAFRQTKDRKLSSEHWVLSVPASTTGLPGTVPVVGMPLEPEKAPGQAEKIERRSDQVGLFPGLQWRSPAAQASICLVDTGFGRYSHQG